MLKKQKDRETKLNTELSPRKQLMLEQKKILK